MGSRAALSWLTPLLALAYWWAMRLILAACLRSASGSIALSLALQVLVPAGATLLALRACAVSSTVMRPSLRLAGASLALGSCLVLPVCFLVDLALEALSPVTPGGAVWRIPLSSVAAQAPPLAELLLLGVVVSAICEELFFRGLVYGRLRAVAQAWSAILVSTLTFALGHATIPAITQACVLGLVLGQARSQTGSIAACIFVHGAFNFQVCLLTCMLPPSMNAWLPEYAADLSPLWLTLATLGVGSAWRALPRASHAELRAPGSS